MAPTVHRHRHRHHPISVPRISVDMVVAKRIWVVRSLTHLHFALAMLAAPAAAAVELAKIRPTGVPAFRAGLEAVAVLVQLPIRAAAPPDLVVAA